MPRIKAAQLAVNALLPADMRDYGRALDSKDVNNILAEIARRNPDDYGRVTKGIGDIGRKAAYWQGETVKLSDLKPPIDTAPIYAAMDADVAAARGAIKNEAEFSKARENIWQTYNKLIDKQAMAAGLAAGNNLALAVSSGARGKNDHFKAMTVTPGLFSDGEGKTVPMFVRQSYGQGLRPAAWLGTTYGARAATISTKTATAKGGAFSKLLGQAMVPLVVTTQDCGVRNGVDLPADDKSLRGRVLATDVGGYKAGTIIDRDFMNTMKKSKTPAIVARSVLTCQAPEGVCAKCVGMKAEGHLPKIGDFVGGTAGNAIGEPITQSALNVKHCLLVNTLVRMADFSVRPIQDIQPGEQVLGADIHGNTFPVVVKAVVDQGRQPVMHYEFSCDCGRCHVDLFSTDCHKVLAKLGQGQPQRITIAEVQESRAELLLAADPHVCKDPVTCVKMEPLGALPCWDISVDHPDELFVLANGMIVKNTGGMSSAKKDYAGFGWINQFMQSPEVFQDRAPVARKDGIVQDIRPAAQGGFYVTQAGQEHYVLPGFKVLVKPGDNLESGDALSEGLVDPYEIVELRGLGEGRKYYVDRLMKMLDDSGMPAERGNVELVARATLDHVRVKDTDKVPGNLPDDVVSYNALSGKFRPPVTAKKMPASEAVGKYLQQPTLHYTIGTKMTPRMVKHLEGAGIKDLWADDEDPGFEPEMVRLAAAGHASQDWIAAQHTSYLTRQLKDRAARGQDSNIESNIHFAPRLAYGVGFGKQIETTGKF